MKISEAVLMEALRFRSSDFKLVDTKAKEFQIGIEYEIHIDGEYLDGQPDYDGEGDEVFDEEGYHDAVLNARSDLMDSKFEQLESNLSDFEDSDIVVYLDGSITKLKTAADKFADGELFDTIYTKEDISNIFGDTELSDLINEFENIEYRLPESMDVYAFLSGIVDGGIKFKHLEGELRNWQYAFNSMSHGEEVDATDLFNLIDMLRRVRRFADTATTFSPTELARKYADSPFIDSFEEDMYEEAEGDVETSDFITYEGGGGSRESAVAFTEQNLPDNINQYIERIEIDPSVSSGCEVITNPLSIHDALFVMKEMFKFIRQYGSTSDSTGMHVNLSHRLMKNSMSLDGLKLMILADPDYHQGFTKRNDRQMWRPREYVSSMTRGIKFKSAIYDIADQYIQHGIFGIERGINMIVSQREKYQAINLSHSQIRDVEQRRIEFRYFGGEDYHTKYDIIRNDIYYLCYIMLGAVDPNFLKKEYNQELFKYIDRVSKEVLKQPFLDVVAEIKSDFSPVTKINKKITDGS